MADTAAITVCGFTPLPGVIRLTDGRRAAKVIDVHLDLSALEAGLDEIRQAPADDGRVELIVRRPAEDAREILAEGQLDLTAGLVGDAWQHGKADPERQLTLMNARAVALLATARERWQLAGDQLYVDLHLSYDNLPPGTQLAIGSAVIEVTSAPHRGCKKFAARFGLDALKFVNSPGGYALNLRGIYAKVVQPGAVRLGDRVRKQPAGVPAN